MRHDLQAVASRDVDRRSTVFLPKGFDLVWQVQLERTVEGGLEQM
jgi:hypothetical protein